MLACTFVDASLLYQKCLRAIELNTDYVEMFCVSAFANHF